MLSPVEEIPPNTQAISMALRDMIALRVALECIILYLRQINNSVISKLIVLTYLSYTRLGL